MRKKAGFEKKLGFYRKIRYSNGYIHIELNAKGENNVQSKFNDGSNRGATDWRPDYERIE